ncbi:MAG: hypothetical protein KTR24_13655 [Saprospiraceae bacterium]|nr:hypothetical protein [Saprospiraceae bacterium]
MRPLEQKYKDRLKQIGETIQASDELKKYLEDEEEEDYLDFQSKHEKALAELHHEVVSKDPLQLFELEEELLDPVFEGLFLPRILGYSVLRGEINEDYKYVRPQDHFQKVLLTIANSFYFDLLKNRVGQSIQIGFALSSNIWITNLLEEIDNKQVKVFLQSQRIDKYRDLPHRRSGYNRFALQFRTTNYQTTQFPKTPAEMIVHFGSVRNFLEYRIATSADHTNYTKEVMDLLSNESLYGTKQYMHILGLVANNFDLDAANHAQLSQVIKKQRSTDTNFAEMYFSFLEKFVTAKSTFKGDCDARMASLLDLTTEDDLTGYYRTMELVAKKGFVHEDSLEAVRTFYNQHDGLSVENNCLRRSVLGQITQVLGNLDEDAYQDYFELTKTMVSYMDVFDYQQFNQSLKESSTSYVKKLLKKFTDKRGRDYQDIKKFVIPTFQDLGFMNEKQVLEMFKTRRKRKAS